MGRTKKIINGSMEKISQKTIEYNTIYSFTNMKDGALTGAEMTALLTPAYEGFVAKDSMYWCCESGGAYSEGHFYKFTITGTSPLDNVASWTDLGTLGGGSPADNIIDIGAGQVTFEDGTVYPTISKTDADEIYLKYVSGQPITLLWGTTGIATHISVIYASDISGYELHCLIHGKVAVYNWTDSTTGNIVPTIQSVSAFTPINIPVNTQITQTGLYAVNISNSAYLFSVMLSINDLDFDVSTFGGFYDNQRNVCEVSYNSTTGRITATDSEEVFSISSIMLVAVYQ